MTGEARALIRLYGALLEIVMVAEPDEAIAEVTRSLAEVTDADAGYLGVHVGGCTRQHMHSERAVNLAAAMRVLAPQAVVRREPLCARIEDSEFLVAAIGGSKQLGIIVLERTRPVAFDENDRHLVKVVAAQFALVAERLPRTTPMTLEEEIDALEERRIQHSLVRHHGNVSETARELRVSRTRVYRILAKMKSRNGGDASP